MRYKTTKEELEFAIKNSKSIANVCRILNIRPNGGNYRTLYSKIKEWNFDISHFTGQGWNVGLVHKPNVARPLSEILVENSNYLSTNKLRIRLIEEGIKEHKCEKCKLKKWQKKLIPLELNHINGINNDNRIENLELLCPNCHAQTSNYRGKNKLSIISELRKNNYISI